MKRIIFLPAVLVAGLLAFTLVGCSGGSASQPMDENTMKGIWALDSQSDIGFGVYVALEDDSEVEMVLADSYLDGTWSVSGTSGSLVLDDNHTVKMSYSNNKLILGNSEGSRLVLVKDDSEQAKQIIEYGMIPGSDGFEFEELEYVEPVIEKVDPFTIADDANATITVTGKGTDFTADPGYEVSITNKTNKTVYFLGEDDFNVGGKKIEAGLDDELEPGETLVSFIYFDKDEVGGGADALGTIDGTFLMIDDDTDDTIASYPIHIE